MPYSFLAPVELTLGDKGGEMSIKSALKELGMRTGAAAVVVGVFVGLGYLNRTDFLGLSSALGTQHAFFAAAFLLVGVLSGGWVLIQQYRS
ncbi:hypothetical protein [Haloferax sp. DFSO60]|uniref:hypothetical protein n=1 Tax=Haloferax sp. DFSO60 TaxID=3388652 RepID=UPI00397D000B